MKIVYGLGFTIGMLFLVACQPQYCNSEVVQQDAMRAALQVIENNIVQKKQFDDAKLQKDTTNFTQVSHGEISNNEPYSESVQTSVEMIVDVLPDAITPIDIETQESTNLVSCTIVGQWNVTQVQNILVQFGLHIRRDLMKTLGSVMNKEEEETARHSLYEKIKLIDINQYAFEVQLQYKVILDKKELSVQRFDMGDLSLYINRALQELY